MGLVSLNSNKLRSSLTILGIAIGGLFRGRRDEYHVGQRHGAYPRDRNPQIHWRPKKDILQQFLLEAVFLSEVGGVAGILIGIIAGNVIAMAMDVPAIFPWFWTGVALLTCSVIGIVFGMYPAWKAASLHPIDALRFE